MQNVHVVDVLTAFIAIVLDVIDVFLNLQGSMPGQRECVGLCR